MKRTRNGVAVGAAVVLGLAAPACATKKHVRGVVAPIEERLSKVEKQRGEDRAAIEELESGVSRADERALGAERQAAQASKEALKAGDQAAEAARLAQAAQNQAEAGMARLGGVERALESIGNYKFVSDLSVAFGFDRSELDEEAKAKLDALAGTLSGLGNYVIEVQGFTDKLGRMQYNLELSRRRASAVVRYLTVKHQVPLRRFHLLGVGEENPVADSDSREGRKQNRRVEIKVFAEESVAAQKRRIESRLVPPPR